MNKLQFTKKSIADLQPVAGKQYDAWDLQQRGLGVRVSPGGSKTFFVMQRVNGKLVRVKLGVFPEMTVEAARKGTIAALVQMNDGINPNAVKKEARADQQDKRLVLVSLFNAYLAGGGKDGAIRETTKAAYRSQFKRLLPFHNKRVDDLDGTVVKALHKQLKVEKGTYAANASIGLLRSLCRFAMDTYGKPAKNPVDGVTWFKETPRRESLAPESTGEFLQALGTLKGNTAADLFTLLLFVGLRKSEAMGLEWNDLDLDKGVLLISDTKTGKPLHIPLSGYVVDLLKRRKADQAGGSKWVFPSNSRAGHITNTHVFVEQLKQRGVRVYPHLLRKTFTTVGAMVCPGVVVEILTGHEPQGITGKYYTFPSIEELRPHVETITKELLKRAAY